MFQCANEAYQRERAALGAKSPRASRNIWEAGMHYFAIALNLIASLASAASGVIALAHPELLSKSPRRDVGETFYARMYAIRTIPVSLSAGLLPFWSGGAAVFWVLVLAGAIQAADVGVGVSHGERRMTVGAAVGAIVHFVCAFVLAAP